jgi:hypothetical protein
MALALKTALGGVACLRALRAPPARALPLPYSGLAGARAEWEGPTRELMLSLWALGWDAPERKPRRHDESLAGG